MSLSRMNTEERASYLVGEAVRRYIENTPWSAEKESELEILKRWLKKSLAPAEWTRVVKVMTFSEHLVDPPTPLRDVPF